MGDDPDSLATFPFFEQAENDGLLTLHGARIDIADGEMHGLEGRTFAKL